MVGKSSKKSLSELYFEDTMQPWNSDSPVDRMLKKKWLKAMAEIGKRAEEKLKEYEKEDKKNI